MAIWRRVPCALVALAAAGGALAAAGGEARAQARVAPGTDAAPALGATESPAARAASLFTEGLEALDRGEWGVALDRLRLAFALQPRPLTMLNIAQAYRGAGRAREAVASYRRYLALGAGEVPPERERAVRNTISALEAATATLRIASEPPGARVRVDALDAGVTPLGAPLALLAGAHDVQLEHPGFVRVRERLELRAGESRALTFRLANPRTAATLVVDLVGDVPGARATIDGIEVGAPPLHRQLDPGGHRLEVRAPGREGYRAELVLGAGQVRTIAVRLDRTRGVLEQPGFWVAVGVVALLAGGAVTAGVVLGNSAARTDEVLHTVPPAPSR